MQLVWFSSLFFGCSYLSALPFATPILFIHHQLGEIESGRYYGKPHKLSPQAKPIMSFSRTTQIRAICFFLSFFKIIFIVVAVTAALKNAPLLAFILFVVVPQYSFYMHQKYETAIKATHDNSRAIIELHEVHTLIVCFFFMYACVCAYSCCCWLFFSVVCLFVCLVFNTNRTRYKLKTKYDRVQCVDVQAKNCS